MLVQQHGLDLVPTQVSYFHFKVKQSNHNTKYNNLPQNILTSVVNLFFMIADLKQL